MLSASATRREFLFLDEAGCTCYLCFSRLEALDMRSSSLAYASYFPFDHHHVHLE